MIGRAKSVLHLFMPRNAFARGVTVLVGGTVGAQIISVLAVPLTTRLYAPEDFGLVAVYGSLLALILVVSSLRYELAIPLPEDAVEAASVTSLSLSLVLLMTVLSGALVVLFRESIATVLGLSVLAGYLWFLPIGVLLAGTYSALSYWSVRTKQFSVVARTRVRQSLASIAIQLVGFKLGGISLLLGHLAGQSAGTTSIARSSLAMPAFRQVRWEGIWRAAVRYRRFPLFSTWEGLSNSLSHQLPLLVFAVKFGAGPTGLYSIAHRVLSLPLSLVGTSIGQVFFADAAEAHRKGSLGALVDGLYATLAHVGLPPAVVLVLLGPELFAYGFGENWRPAGELARWMAPWLYLQFISSPLSTVVFVTERQKQGLYFQLVLLSTRVGAIVLGAWAADFSLSVRLYAGASAGCYLGLLFMVLHLTGGVSLTRALPAINAAGITLVCTAPISLMLILEGSSPNLWPYALAVSVLLIMGRYWQLLKGAY
jgi:O-antigen/teichoic acid export membrane protein